MKLMILGLILHISFFAYSQPEYLCKYSDTIGVISYEKQIESMRAPLMDNGMSPDIFDAYILKFFPDKNSFLVTSEREVLVYRDSSIIELAYTSNKSFNILFQLPSRKLKMVKGNLSRYNESASDYSGSLVSDSVTTFSKSPSKKRSILGYLCSEYISLDRSVIIWVCDDLPGSINLGIPVKNVKGAVLAFEARNGNGITQSCIITIEKKPKKTTLEKKETSI